MTGNRAVDTRCVIAAIRGLGQQRLVRGGRFAFMAAIGLLVAASAPAQSASQEDLEICQQTGDIDRSIAACTRIAIDQTVSAADRATIYVLLGNAYQTKNNLDSAIAAYNDAIRLDQRNVFAYSSRAIAYSLKGDFDRATADYNQAKALDPAKIQELTASNEELRKLSAGIRPSQTVTPDIPASGAIQATIRADKGWQATDAVIRGAGTVDFHAVGRWVFNPGLPAVDGDGAAQFSTQGRAEYAYHESGGREGQLIGRIGNGRPFIVGANSSHTITNGESGTLYLVINDDLNGKRGKGVTDNSGRLDVTVNVR
jgi:tetratricopeptide (TPR) repeat protein